MALSEKILNLRKQRGMSQEDLAERLNISRQAVSRWETGSALPDASNLLQLSRLFGVSADYLLNDDYEEDRQPDVEKTGAAAAHGRRKRLGLCMAALGLLGNFIIYVLSRFIEVMVPRAVHRNGETWYELSSGLTGYSYKYFVQEHNLEFLTAVFYLLIAAGLAIAFVNRDRLREKLCRRKKRNEKGTV